MRSLPVMGGRVDWRCGVLFLFSLAGRVVMAAVMALEASLGDVRFQYYVF